MNRYWWLWVFVIALAPRLLYLQLAQPQHAGEYWDLSTSLIRQGMLGQSGVPTTRFEPLYPLFLWAARLITGDRAVLVQALQAAVAASGAVWMFLLADALTSKRRLAWTAALIFSVYPLLIRHATAPSESALTTALLPLFAWLFVRGGGRSAAAMAGAVLGLAILNRAVVLPVLPLAWVSLARRERTSAAALAAAALLVVSPMLVRNYLVGGVLLPSRNGVNLFMGNTRYAAAIMPEHSPDLLQAYAYRVAFERVPHLDPHSPTIDDQVDATLAAAAIDEILSRPLATFMLKLRYVFYFFTPGLVPSRVLLPETTIELLPDGRANVAGAPVRPLAERAAHGLSTLLLLSAAAIGIGTRRHQLSRDGILWLILATFVVSHAVYFPATRYTAPVVFVLIFYAAAGLDAAWRRIRSAEDHQ